VLLCRAWLLLLRLSAGARGREYVMDKLAVGKWVMLWIVLGEAVSLGAAGALQWLRPEANPYADMTQEQVRPGPAAGAAHTGGAGIGFLPAAAAGRDASCGDAQCSATCRSEPERCLACRELSAVCGLALASPRRERSPALAQVDEAHTTEMQGIQARLGFGGARAERKGQSRRAPRAAHPC